MATHYRFIVYSFNFHNQCTLLISLNIKTFDSWQMFLFQSDRPTGALSFAFILSILLNRFLSIDAQHTLSLSYLILMINFTRNVIEDSQKTKKNWRFLRYLRVFFVAFLSIFSNKIFSSKSTKKCSIEGKKCIASQYIMLYVRL